MSHLHRSFQHGNLKRKKMFFIKRIKLQYNLTIFFAMLLILIILTFFASALLKRTAATDVNAERINLILTVCDEVNLIKEAIIMMKSAIIFRNSFKLHFIIFTGNEPEWLGILVPEIEKLKSSSTNSFTYELRNVTHRERDIPMWRCAMERLYAPDTLSEIDKALYVDLDILFLNDLAHIWNQFELMNSTQLCGAGRDSVNPYWSHYRNLKPNIPRYADGLNSGVLLMDLKKMREFGWTTLVTKVLKDFAHLDIFDQEIVNIIFHYHPDRLFLLPCRFNANDLLFRSIDDICTDAIRYGLNILHGTGRRFLTPLSNAPFLHKFYEPFAKYELGTNLYENLSKPLIQELERLPRGPGKSILRFYLEANGVLSSEKMNYTA